MPENAGHFLLPETRLPILKQLRTAWRRPCRNSTYIPPFYNGPVLYRKIHWAKSISVVQAPYFFIIRKYYTKTMDVIPVVEDEDLDMGMGAFCTPAPGAAKRRLWAGEDAAKTRPFTSQSRRGGSE